MVTYSTILLCFLLRKEGIVRERRILRGRGRESRPTLDIFKEERRREREKGRKRRRRRRSRMRKGTSLPLKTDLTLVIYKILKKTLVL